MAIGEYYHLYNRGTDKRDVFMDAYDRNRFMTLLYLCNSREMVNIENQFRKGLTFSELMKVDRDRDIVHIGAYCLMLNHFHILIREKEENGISLFMQKLSTAYTMYFNKKYKRSGALFEGTYKSRHIDTDEYLKYLFSYIHLNPVKIIEPRWKENSIVDRVRAKKYLEKYYCSSYLDYIGLARKESKILERGAFPEYFSKPKDFSDFIEDWLSFDPQS